MDIDIRSAQEVFEIEARVLHEVSASLGKAFIDTVTLISSMSQGGKGRLILSGVGKSGLVSRKWAATFSSTGTPAFYINPVEAAHGDLGVIRPDDVLILLSHSGENEEYAHLVRHAREAGVKIVGVTSQKDSTLARASTITLWVPISKEACPLGLAPTASTTAMMAMGDALALMLMKLSGFTTEDFARIHPGGRLGRRYFLKVQGLLRSDLTLPMVSPQTTMMEAVRVMTAQKRGVILVCEGKKLLGIVTDGDLRRCLEKRISFHETPVSDVMTRNPKTISVKALAFEAQLMMKEHSITHLVALDANNEVAGLVHYHDLLVARI